MIFNRWQCWILSIFKDFSGHSFIVEVKGERRRMTMEERSDVSDDYIETKAGFLTGYILHCTRCGKHNLFLTENSKLKIGETPEIDAFRLPV